MKTQSAMSKVASLSLTKLAVSLSVALVVLSGCGNKEAEEQVKKTIVSPALTEIVKQQANTDLSFNGVVRSAQRADLSFQVSGRVDHIFVNEGDRVTKGQLLAKLDPKDAQTVFAAAQLELSDAGKAYQRGKAIYESSQAISKSDLDKLIVRFDLARNRVNEAKNKLAYTQLVAPFDGIIGRKLIDNHVQVQANNPVLTLHNIDNLEVVINITDSVMMSGMTCNKGVAEINNNPDLLLPLSLRTFSTQADPITQTYSVVLGITDTRGINILPGMAVKVSPDLKACPQENRNPIIVPLTAVVPDNKSKQFVWVVNKDNTVAKRYINVGKVNKNCITVVNGLSVGERIVIAGVSKLKPGMEVRPYTDNTQNGA
ncbi:efflux RND transporter periplasmic adaptor subunit [Photobacterium leiognathi]|uniref:efflux RND transporter periplasmic adaptor subunit n=1 Tax=Photobacterium leiognathi TaxID=553611 RepID=UPI002980DF54|nr:efflux RND transporter periplasmic adaptor subunit [Photobacterium leiognathi]